MKPEAPFLSERYQEILCLLIADYIATADPVASRHLSKRILSRLSPATIRNIMADLEEMGFLEQPHTSAGRIPTEKGLRYYVDSLVEMRSLSEQERLSIQKQYQSGEQNIDAMMKKTGKILAAFSKCVGIVATPKRECLVFKHIEFLPLSHGRLLGIFVSQTGDVENRILDIREELNFREIEKINNYCNRSFVGLTLEEARNKVVEELTQAKREYDRLLYKALLFSKELLGNIQGTELVVERESALLQHPDAPTFDTIRDRLASLEEQQQLLRLLDTSLHSEGVRIFIGNEHLLQTGHDTSLVTANYRQGSQVLGTLGVIGPTHMDYSRVIPVVDFTAKLVSDFLEKGVS